MNSKLRYWPACIGIALLFVCACGGGDSGASPDAGPVSAPPCEGPTPPADCQSQCTSDSSCRSGFYCGAEALCTADCTPAGNQCGSGEICNSRGKCERGTGGGPSNGNGDGGTCARVQVETNIIPPIVQLLIDHSGSMNQNFGGGNSRIEAVDEALLDNGRGVVGRLESQVKFGATLYTSEDGAPPCPTLTSVAPSINNFESIEDSIGGLLRDSRLGEDTPTGESVRQVANQLPVAEEGEQRVIILATDGEPDTCSDPDPQDENNDAERERREQVARDVSVSAIEDAHDDLDIDVYVLSVGDDIRDFHMQEMANVGIGLDRDNGNAPFFVANDPEELVNALNQIVGIARGCRFSVEGEIQDPQAGTVELDGQLLDFGTDWILVDPSTIELIGAACDAFLSSDVAALNAEFDCDAVELPDLD